ncbi:hypothetical protein cyc_02031 [Cyclospora cayetanensis]|uniref:Uncharacterized protein n=1 Tax=Cyclospora cayetanensis TaxID=88456 RepID=A0A1D3CW86_9EIME|nr:hypothetical protein cyc_02031 [Cyclospora cayetanensis]
MDRELLAELGEAPAPAGEGGETFSAPGFSVAGEEESATAAEESHEHGKKTTLEAPEFGVAAPTHETSANGAEENETETGDGAPPVSAQHGASAGNATAVEQFEGPSFGVAAPTETEAEEGAAEAELQEETPEQGGFAPPSFGVAEGAGVIPGIPLEGTAMEKHPERGVSATA